MRKLAVLRVFTITSRWKQLSFPSGFDIYNLGGVYSVLCIDDTLYKFKNVLCNLGRLELAGHFIQQIIILSKRRFHFYQKYIHIYSQLYGDWNLKTSLYNFLCMGFLHDQKINIDFFLPKSPSIPIQCFYLQTTFSYVFWNQKVQKKMNLNCLLFYWLLLLCTLMSLSKLIKANVSKDVKLGMSKLVLKNYLSMNKSFFYMNICFNKSAQRRLN